MVSDLLGVEGLPRARVLADLLGPVKKNDSSGQKQEEGQRSLRLSTVSSIFLKSFTICSWGEGDSPGQH